MTRKPSDLSDEDRDAWEADTAEDRKLHPKRHAETPPSATPSTSRRSTEAPPLLAPDITQKPLPELEIGDNSQVDRRTAESLCRGKMPIEARLDLHGYTRQQAYDALIPFILSAYEQQKRCVLVITGKGGRDALGKGILQQVVPEWLNVPAIRPAILMTTPAQPKDGGEGALYILLRRKR